MERQLDYADYLATPEDGKRYEILRGELHVTPAPSPRHQWISWLLECELDRFFRGRGLGRMFHAPIDVILTDKDVVQPDIIVVTEPATVTDRGIEGAPLLVVEILSPGTRVRDRGVKGERYAELGVEHYWLVDPEARRVECLRAQGGRSFEMRAEASGDATLTHPDWPGLVIDLGELWR
jgi:Uma2 family endonuclease